ncbi:uncharacterized protein LOC122403584 [Colletes gigas]|uniref:uncharacterized protein LOC122403584 n=1 Tax=Colletes gigas TaxID=935657 RepID=UPI001C9AC204|nr:uncharacterized protein LOC122403584 [Colletes gigas]
MQLSNLLQKIKVPAEFQRTTRSLTEFHKFKATEYRFLLLYAGPVVFKKNLRTDVYRHLLLFHTGSRILSSKELAVDKCESARLYLKKFVTKAPFIYNKEFVVGIVHNLIHLADDVENMNCSLSNISSFPFENTLGRMKRLIHNGNKPLSQLCRRWNEISHSWNEKADIPPTIQITRQLISKELERKIPIKRVQYKEALLSTTFPNNTVLLNSNEIVQVCSMWISPNDDVNYIEITGKILRKRKALYSYPCNSHHLQMWNVSGRITDNIIFKITDIKKKMVLFDFSDSVGEKILVMPLLHM